MDIKYGMNGIMKRLFDIVFSCIGLLLLMPLFVVLTVLIKLDDKGPVFFRQERIGKGFRPFRIFKFRTMAVVQSGNSSLVTVRGDKRVTRVGKFLRRTKMDELPQLINVFKGDMSVVGPRPEVARYVEMFEDDYQEILQVKPGITDYATIEFRDEESVLSGYEDMEVGYIDEVLPRKIELYKKYLRERGFLLDLKLIVLTLWKIIK